MTVGYMVLVLRESKRPQEASNDETLDANIMASLRSQRDRLIDRRNSYQKIYYVQIGSSVLIMSTFLTFPLGFTIGSIVTAVLAPIVLLAALAMTKNQLGNFEEALQDVDVEIDLQRYKSTTRESRAEFNTALGRGGLPIEPNSLVMDPVGDAIARLRAACGGLIAGGGVLRFRRFVDVFGFWRCWRLFFIIDFGHRISGEPRRNLISGNFFARLEIAPAHEQVDAELHAAGTVIGPST